VVSVTLPIAAVSVLNLNKRDRRPDLIRLLDSFPQDTARPGTMSPARLRAALGLS